MECPKCHSIINDNETVCPKCHKVFLLECPNCHSLEETSTCTKCGYKILVKCSKCGKINPTINDLCTKCGFPTKTSIAFQECESDELASVTIKFDNLKKIRRLLKSRDLYDKFIYKLKNLILAAVKNTDGMFISYGEIFVLNFNKELSLPTSANKAVRFALKLANAFSQLNSNILEELKIPLGLNITIAKKLAEDLQTLKIYTNNVKLLNIKHDGKKYLKGMQIILDQYVRDEINKDYKTDSLYSTEENGQTTMFYEIVLDSYILPPDNEKNDDELNINKQELPKNINKNPDKADLYSFNVFDINAKCKFETASAVSIKEKLETFDFENKVKILSIRAKSEFRADISDIVEIMESKGYKILTVNCTEIMNYEAWGFFTELFKLHYGLPHINNPSKNNTQIIPEIFSPLKDLCLGKAAQASTPEDARFMYIELWGKFLSVLSDTAIIIDGFENLDDTSLETIELYLDKLRNITPNFIFITSDNISAHSKIKELLRTDKYTELKLEPSPFSNCLSTIKNDASDFIKSFYFEKIQENFNGSYLYFKYAVKYLLETGVLINFENKLLVKDSKSIVVPIDLCDLYKARLKNLGKNQSASLMIGYSTILYPGLDINTFELLDIKNPLEHSKILIDSGLARLEKNNLLINNFPIFKEVIETSIKKEAEAMLVKNIISKLKTSLSKAEIIMLLGKLSAFGDEYSILCKNADFAIATGDYDAYLKNCLGFLSLIEMVKNVVPEEDIAERKKEVYESILKYLYSYAPAKIYFIENILLTDAIQENNDEKIVRLSNMMLQGALISSNYTEALGLLHNILSRMQNPTLLVDGAINAKFLLLSLVNIEILYNIGKFKECVETAMEILSVLSIDIIDKIKPAGFSTNSFISHLMETMRIAAFAKLYLMEDGLEDFIELVKSTLNTDFSDGDCILAIKDFLAGKTYNTENIENYSAFAKMIFLILQEISNLQESFDYNKFAQNIYQAKLLAEDLYQMEIKYFCDLLIGYAYSKKDVITKAEHIYKDVLDSAEKSALFNIIIVAKYFMAKLSTEPEKTLLIINDALDIIRKHENQAVILYALFEKLYIDVVHASELNIPNIDSEEQKLSEYKDSLKMILN